MNRPLTTRLFISTIIKMLNPNWWQFSGCFTSVSREEGDVSKARWIEDQRLLSYSACYHPQLLWTNQQEEKEKQNWSLKFDWIFWKKKKLKYFNVAEWTIRQRVYDLVKEVVSSRVKLFHCHIKGVTAAWNMVTLIFKFATRAELNGSFGKIHFWAVRHPRQIGLS